MLVPRHRFTSVSALTLLQNTKPVIKTKTAHQRLTVSCPIAFISPISFSLSASRTMSRATGGGANDVTRFLSSGAGPGSPTSNAAFSAASQADWAAKRLVWVPSEKHGFEVSQYCPLIRERDKFVCLFVLSNKHLHLIQILLNFKELQKGEVQG